MIHVWRNGKADLDLVTVYFVHVLNYQNVPHKEDKCVSIKIKINWVYTKIYFERRSSHIFMI